MNGIVSGIKNFYSYYHTSAEIKVENPTQWVIKTSFCKRTDFLKAACDGLAFLINNVCLTVLFATASVVTLGLVSSFKASCCQNAYAGLVQAGSIPVSIFGIIFPQTVNQNFLKLTPMECNLQISGNELPVYAVLLGGIVARQRL